MAMWVPPGWHLQTLLLWSLRSYSTSLRQDSWGSGKHLSATIASILKVFGLSMGHSFIPYFSEWPTVWPFYGHTVGRWSTLGSIPHHVIWYDMIWYDTIRYDMIRYDMYGLDVFGGFFDISTSYFKHVQTLTSHDSPNINCAQLLPSLCVSLGGRMGQSLEPDCGGIEKKWPRPTRNGHWEMGEFLGFEKNMAVFSLKMDEDGKLCGKLSRVTPLEDLEKVSIFFLFFSDFAMFFLKPKVKS